MELMRRYGSVKTFLQKNRIVVLLLAAGFVILLFPEKNAEQEDVTTIRQPTSEHLTAEAIETVLKEIHGAGDVRVLLSVANGEQIIYQNDSESSQSDTDNNEQVETVLITDTQRAQQGLIRQINPPIFLGAIVVCQGAENPSVRLQITQAVSKITGLGTDQICVLKMK